MKYIFSMILILFVGILSASATTLTIDLAAPSGNTTMNIVLATPYTETSVGTYPQELIADFEKDIRYVPFLRLMQQYKVTYTPNNYMDFASLTNKKINILLTTVWRKASNAVNVEIRAFETLSGSIIANQRFVVANEQQLQIIADKVMSQILEYLIGDGSLFENKIFFVRQESKLKYTLWSMYVNGRDLQKEMNISGVALSPAVSANGRYVVFTHIDRRRHTLALLDRKTKKIRRIIYPHGTSVIGPTFMPDGNIAVALSFSGAPSIYQVSSKNLNREKPLVSDRRINVSPSFSLKDKNLVVYTSNKFGGPQVFMKNLRTGEVERISKEGTYNTDPVFSPDGRYIAYVRMIHRGARKIFVYDTVTKKTKQVSFGKGDDDTPSFSRDSYFISFVSTRNGKYELFLTTREGTGAVKIPVTGRFLADPTWGLAK